jgi:hypothetical protein
MKQSSLALLLFVFEVAMILLVWRSDHLLKQAMPLAMLGEVSFCVAFSKELISLKRREDGSVVGARKRFAIVALGLFGLITVGLGGVTGIRALLVTVASAILTLVGKLLTIRFVRQHGVAESRLS